MDSGIIMNENKPIYNALDVLKFAGAILIVCAHTASGVVTFSEHIDRVFSLYIVVVPFFFTCSAFLFFSKLQSIDDRREQWLVYKHFAKRLLLMYLLWSAIYFPFIFIGWLKNGATASVIFEYFYKSIVFSSYATIWFLPALLTGVSITFVLRKWLSCYKVLAIGCVFYLIGTMGYSYAGFVQKSPHLQQCYDILATIFISTRNGIFNGFPYAALGAFIAQSRRETNGASCFVLAGLFGALFVIEAFMVQHIVGFPVGGADTVILLLPFTFFFFKWALTVRLRNRAIYIWLREVSLVVFLSQRLFLSAIPSLLPPWVMQRLAVNTFVGFAIMVGTIVAFSTLLVALGRQFSGLRRLW